MADEQPTLRLDPIAIDATRSRTPQALDQPGFVTVVVPGEASARVVSVAELVEREAGVRVRSAGGPGSYSAISIRGSDAAEVSVFLDGVPLNAGAAAAVDLSQLPVDGLERVEIYRGFVPPELGGQAVGGAINLVSRKGSRTPTLRLSAGGGSFGTRSLVAGYGFGGRALRVDATASYRGSSGDFTYYDDNGTLLRTDDDHAAVRRDNGFDQGAADVTLAGGGRTRFAVGVHGFLKAQGVPLREGGTASLPSGARLATGRAIVDGSVDRAGLLGPSIDGHLAAHLLFQWSAFDNLAGAAVGTGLRTRTDAASVQAGFDASLHRATRHDLFGLLVSGALDHYAPTDLAGPHAAASSDRRRVAVTAVDELHLLGDRLALTASVRLDALDNRLAPSPFVFGTQAAGSQAGGSWLSPQIGVRVRATSWLSWKASAGEAVRLPSLFELFGDNAFVLARPNLRPERSLGGDVGFAADGRRGALTLALEAGFFGRRVDDYIALLQSGYATAYDNVGSALVLGAEARGRLRLGAHASLAGDYTFIHGTTDASAAFPGSEGKALPGVPAHKLDVRAEGSLGPFTLFYRVAWTSTVFLSVQMDDGPVAPARALHGLGFSAGPFDRAPVVLAFEVENLGDLRVVEVPLPGSIHDGATRPSPLADYQGYPLPGRAFYATLSYRPRLGP